MLPPLGRDAGRSESGCHAARCSFQTLRGGV